MSNKLVGVLQRMANESWRGSPEHAALTAAIAALSAPQPPARMASIPESSPNGWLQAGGLLYRLTEGHRPENRDEIYVTMVHGSRDPAHCEARASEILAMLQSQPPAEAQAVAWEWEYIGGDHYPRGHKVARSLREMDPTNPPYPETWRPTRPLIYGDTAPPSAPVGVEGVRREIQNALRELDAVMTAEDNTSDAVGCAELALQRALEALALTGTTCKCAQQPAAVDDLMNAWRAAFITERATRYREGGMKIEQARIHAETDATLMEKIARQQQGGES